MTDTMNEQVQEVLDKLRPFLLRDGGDCELVDVLHMPGYSVKAR